MAKETKGVFFCKECGYESVGYMGKCPSCGAWNSFVSAPTEKADKKSGSTPSILFGETTKAKLLRETASTTNERTKTGIGELDRVLGGGLVKGSLVLISGDPGIGKSTLMLMLSAKIATKMRVLYVSGEESCEQIKMRSDRLGQTPENLYVLSETNMDKIYDQIDELKPDCLIIDSIQTMCDDSVGTAAGTATQIREITGGLMKVAKTRGITTFVVGHVTKEGSIAGPKILEHMVDTVLYFEGERQLFYRIMRCVKNRFGSTNEIGVFEMTGSGLKEVPNPSAAFLEGRPMNVPGTAVACVLEGTRPMLVEIQALVSSASGQNPRRMSTGIDFNRLSMLMAVLEKRGNMNVGFCDAFVNVVGGIKIDEPAADLALVASLVSSFGNFPVPADCVFFGEIGLTGEVRAVTHAEKRLSEVLRLGFKHCYMPLANKAAVEEIAKKELTKEFPTEIRYISSIKELRW